MTVRAQSAGGQKCRQFSTQVGSGICKGLSVKFSSCEDRAMANLTDSQLNEGLGAIIIKGTSGCTISSSAMCASLGPGVLPAVSVGGIQSPRNRISPLAPTIPTYLQHHHMLLPMRKSIWCGWPITDAVLTSEPTTMTNRLATRSGPCAWPMSGECDPRSAGRIQIATGTRETSRRRPCGCLAVRARSE